MITCPWCGTSYTAFQSNCDGLGLEPAQLWPSDQGHAVILDIGRATLEIFDEAQAATVDQIEVGRRVSGPIRFALQVPE